MLTKQFFKKRETQMHEDSGHRGRTFYGITLGRVVSTDDPQQMGRLYVLCPDLGDSPTTPPEDYTNLPICTYMAPFAGATGSDFARGSEPTYSKGGIAYGMWSIPKRGAIVGVMCINGDPNKRVWVGSVYEQYITNTMPHGRFLYQAQDGTIPHPGGAPHGPVTVTDNPVQPIYDNQTQAFKSRLGNFEWRTRGADFQNTGVIGDDNYYASPCNEEDDDEVEFTQEDGTKLNITQGLFAARDNESAPDNNVYSWTTPGFHAISMDDREGNCRLKLRTSSGHQIIMDDTNERIYINTAKGNNWIEIDQDGSIDIFSSEKISATAKHINFTAEETLRLYGKNGVHIKSDTEIRIQTGTILHTTVGTNMDTEVGGNTKHTTTDHDLLARGGIKETAGSDIDELAGGDIKNTCSTHHTLASVILETAGAIHMNGPQAARAAQAAEADPLPAFWTNRYPLHEPWARTSTLTDFTHTPKYPYNDPLVGREHVVRGPNWRR